jgi:hypothetical protein
MIFKQGYAKQGRCRSTKRTPNSYEAQQEREGAAVGSKGGGGLPKEGARGARRRERKGREKKRKKKIPLRSNIPVVIARQVFRGQVHAVRIFGVIFARGSA